MFWNNFVSLCNERQKSPNGVCAELGLSTAIATRWKNGSLPRDTTLKKIANYFGVTAEELICDSTVTIVAPADSSPSLPPLAPEFYELLNQMTLQELAELKAHMEEKIKNRK